jgi:hypothetical protein
MGSRSFNTALCGRQLREEGRKFNANRQITVIHRVPTSKLADRLAQYVEREFIMLVYELSLQKGL